MEAYVSAANPSGGGFNVDTILRIASSGQCFSNQRSMVHVRRQSSAHSAPAAFMFRNTPHYVSFLTPTHIDAAHEYESVREDIGMWWGLISPGGMMLGDE